MFRKPDEYLNKAQQIDDSCRYRTPGNKSLETTKITDATQNSSVFRNSRDTTSFETSVLLNSNTNRSDNIIRRRSQCDQDVDSLDSELLETKSHAESTSIPKSKSSETERSSKCKLENKGSGSWLSHSTISRNACKPLNTLGLDTAEIQSKLATIKNTTIQTGQSCQDWIISIKWRCYHVKNVLMNFNPVENMRRAARSSDENFAQGNSSRNRR